MEQINQALLALEDRALRKVIAKEYDSLRIGTIDFDTDPDELKVEPETNNNAEFRRLQKKLRKQARKDTASLLDQRMSDLVHV